MTIVTARRFRRQGKGFLVWFQALLLMAGFALGAPSAYATTLTVGTAPGQFSVSPTGAATYQIPIDLPPGVNGLKPSLALLYNSQAGNGLLGQGWSLSGLSVISRCPQTIVQDGAIHMPNLTAKDRFCHDGQRLILIGGSTTYGAAGSIYHTEVDSFQQVTANGTAGTGPASFTVRDRTGLTRQYSAVVLGSDQATPMVWLITRITDPYNNFISFNYNFSGTPYPFFPGVWDQVSEIDYGRKHNTTLGRVLFTYSATNIRQDRRSQYVAGTLVQLNLDTLTGIAVQDGSGTTLRNYTLGYQYGTPTLLKSVQECGNDGLCYSPSTFTYSGTPTDFNLSGTTTSHLGPNGHTLSSGYKVADLDGDGLMDYVYPSNGLMFAEFGAIYQDDSPVMQNGQQVHATDSSTAGVGIAGAVPINMFGDGKQELLVPFYPAPNTPNNTPYWQLMLWDPGVGLVMEAPPLQAGAPDSLSACDPNDPECTADAIAVDMGGKGQQGLLFVSSGQLFFYQNYNGQFNHYQFPTGITVSAVNGTVPKMTLVNYTGSGEPEIYVAGTGVVTWDPVQQNFVLEGAGNLDDANATVFFIDADGSGLTSAVVVIGQNWLFYYNTGQGFSFYNPSDSNYTIAPTGINPGEAAPIDWYGDGRQEIMVTANTSGTSNTFYLFGGDYLGGNWTATNITSSYTLWGLSDLNGDGAADFLFENTNVTPPRTDVYFNQAQPYLLNEVIDGLGRHTDVGYAPLLVVGHGAYVNPCLQVPASCPMDGTNGATQPQEIRDYLPPMYLVDAFAVDSGVVSSGKAQQLFTYYLYGGSKLDQWGRGFAGFQRVEAINANSGLYTDDTYRQDFPFTGMVATSTKSSDSSLSNPSSYFLGATGIVTTCVIINNSASCNGSNWPSTLKTFATGGVTISKTTDNYQDAYAGGNGYSDVNVYSPYTSSSTTQLTDLDSQHIYETTTTTSTYSVVGSSTVIGLDVVATDVKVTTTDSNDSDDSQSIETKTSPSSLSETACPGHPGSATVTHRLPANATTGLSQTETFTYDDATCFLTEDDKTIIDPAGSSRYPMTLTKQFVADGYGNPLQAKVSGSYVSGDSKYQDNNNNSQRVTTMTYDPTERFPATISNPYGQTESLTYDSWGNKLTDMDANGNTVTYTYDGFERKTKQSGPLLKLNTTWVYGGCTGNCTSGVVYQVSQNGSDGSSTTSQYDELGRPVRASHLGFAPNEIINQDMGYDLLGRVVKASAPYKVGATPCWDVKNYDVLNRVTTEYQPMNSDQCSGSASATTGSPERRIGTSYDGLTTTRTVYDPSGDTSIGSEKTVTTLNVLGKPASVKDQGGQNGAQVETDYDYDAWGNLTSVTPPPAQPGGPSPKVLMTYDSIGDKLTMQDPDMGSWAYTYDALGELLTQTDAKGQTVTNTYDLLGRLVSRNEAEGETDWVYDIAYGAGVGKLAYTKGPGGVWEGYAYDGFGETTDKITVVGGQEYWVTNTYNDQGRVSQVVYPNMTAVNVSGMPTTPTGLTVAQVLNPDNSTSFNLAWTLNSATQNGQIFHVYRTPSNVTATITTTVPAQYEIYSGPVPNWQDNTVTKDDTYTWWLQACNDTNCSAYISQSLVVVLPPTVPTFNLPAAVQSAMSWPVSWTTASLGVTGNPGPITYIAQVSYNGGTWAPLNATGTSATETSSGDGSYSFRVQACANGACSNFSAPSTETIAIRPSVPQNITVPSSVTPQTSPASILVNWTGPAINGGTGNLSYTVAVYRNLALQRTSSSQSVPGFTDTESLDGTYSYTVTVCDTVNTSLCASASSSNVAVTLPPVNPGAPTYYGDTQAPSWNISWTQSSSTPGNPSGTVNYELQQSWNGGAFSDVTGTVTPGSTYWQVAKAALQGGYFQNGTYTYQLRACTTDSAVSNTAACTAWIPSPGSGYVTTIAPGVPRSLSIPAQSNWDGSFTVTYNTPAPDTGGVVTGYNLQVYDTACTDPPNPVCHDVLEEACTPSPSTNTTCTFAGGLPAGQNYYGLRVRANDAGIHSPWAEGDAPVIVYTSPPPAPTLNETDASDGSHYTITYSASTATTYQLYFSSSTQTGSWSAWTQVYSGSATSYYTGNPIGQYYLRYYAVACNQHAQCSPNSSAMSFMNPKEAGGTGGCRTCSPINPPTSAPAPGSTASAVSVTPERLALSAHPARTTSMVFTRLAAPGRELPALRALAVNRAVPPRSKSLKRLGLPRLAVAATQPHRRFARLAPRRASALRLLAAANLNPRQTYFLAHAGRTTAPKPGHLRRIRHQEPVVATARYAPPIDPILSMYPPLRGDIRVLAHFVARGGAAPAQVRNADVDCRDADNDVECTTPDSPNALMVGYVYNSRGYLQKVEKLNGSGTAIGELWQATDETAFGQVDQQEFDAPLNSTSGAFSMNDDYDTGTGILKSTTASAADTAGTITNLTACYTWDGYNNLLARQLNEIASSCPMMTPPLNESFTYDAVNRMTQVTDSASNATTMQYDDVGGLSSNGLYTGYAYGSPDSTVCSAFPFGPVHAVSSLKANGVTRNFCYDANGNLAIESGDVTRTMNLPDSWTSYNKPNKIISGAITETFTYGPSRERLQTTVTSSTGSVTTTYIDGLFEQVQDSAGNITYKHYIIAGSTRIGVETIATTSGTVNTDLLSFFVQDQVDSVIAEVTEGLGGLNQQFAVYGHDAWGKARPTSGTGANIALLPGVFQPDSAVMSGQHEGFAGHEDLEDIGIVDMEGRIYDPETGRFLSPDPNVQYPDSSQGYNRYTYVNNNSLSLSDPSGYFAGSPMLGFAAMMVVDYACEGACGAWTPLLAGAAQGYVSSGGDLQQAAISGAEAMTFAAAGGAYGENIGGVQLFARSVTEGLIGGMFSQAGGGRFSDGFVGAFAGSESSSLIGEIGVSPADPGYYNPAYESARVAVSAIVGGTVSRLTGGAFADGAVAAAMQRLFNDDNERKGVNQLQIGNDAHRTLQKFAFGTDPSGIFADQWTDGNGTFFGGRPDLGDKNTLELWEIKSANAVQVAIGEVQVARYSLMSRAPLNSNLYLPGGLPPFFGGQSSITLTGNYATYTYTYMGKGVISYNYQLNPNFIYQPIPIYAPSRMPSQMFRDLPLPEPIP